MVLPHHGPRIPGPRSFQWCLKDLDSRFAAALDDAATERQTGTECAAHSTHMRLHFWLEAANRYSTGTVFVTRGGFGRKKYSVTWVDSINISKLGIRLDDTLGLSL
jgi:hypothetical protein